MAALSGGGSARRMETVSGRRAAGEGHQSSGDLHVPAAWRSRLVGLSGPRRRSGDPCSGVQGR